MNRYRLTLAAAVVCALSLYFLNGKAKQEQPGVVETQPVVASTLSVEPAAQAENAEKVSGLASDSTSNDVEKEMSVDDTQLVDEDLQLAFEPPFPDRTNLFQAPKRQGRGGMKTNGQNETSVELLGFVNVNGQRVALSIDGLVTTLAEGSQAYGIEVISIQPPSVFLRRGKQRWQASFEN